MGRGGRGERRGESKEGEQYSCPTPPSPTTSTRPATRDQARGRTGSCYKSGHARLPSHTPKAPRPQPGWGPFTRLATFPTPMRPPDATPPLGLTRPFPLLRQRVLSLLPSSSLSITHSLGCTGRYFSLPSSPYQRPWGTRPALPAPAQVSPAARPASLQRESAIHEEASQPTLPLNSPGSSPLAQKEGRVW